MTPERWAQIKSILAEALECPEDDRPKLLKRLCAGDSELRTEIDALLAEEEKLHTFIERPAFELGGSEQGEARTLSFSDDEPLPDPALPDRVGPYRIVRELAHGGMGAVYLAERDDSEYRGKVAIKLIRQGIGTDFILRRFRAERQILAGLNHPNIARLLDGGTTSEGLPYLVMEYVDGLPISEYCDSKGLTITERLRLFRQVCSAVHYAHQRLIIHRDIKPGNILVTPEGTAKLLDFGIAKLLTPDDENADQTATGVRLLTPAYASPEQIREEPITTASDVYSLGILLYELLTGYHPYRGSSTNPQEIMRAVCDTVPARPSSLISRTTGPAPLDTLVNAYSAVREGLPEKLRKRLKGDVDNIIMMSIRKQPERRYSSVEALSEDIRRHLEGLPVLARKDTASYRLGKFVSRNRLGIAAAALLAVAITSGVAVSLRQKARAERRFLQVREVAHKVLFDYHDAIADLPGSTPVRKKLVSDAIGYLDALTADSGNDVALQRELAAAYQKVGDIQGNSYSSNLGDIAGARKSYAKSLEIREKLAASFRDDVAIQSEYADSIEGNGDIRFTGNDLSGCRSDYDKALSMRLQVAARMPSDQGYQGKLAELYRKLGDLKAVYGATSLGEMNEGIRNYKDALAIRERLAAQSPGDVTAIRNLASSLYTLAYVLGIVGDFDGAEADGRRSVSLLEAQAAKDPTNTEVANEILGAYAYFRQALADNDKLTEAIQLDEKVVAGITKRSEADPANLQLKHNLNASYNSLGHDLVRNGQPVVAIEKHKKARAIIEPLVSANPGNLDLALDLAVTDLRLGQAYAAIRDDKNALEALLRAGKVYGGLLADNPSETGSTDKLAEVNSTLAGVFLRTGHLDQALETMRRSVSEAEEVSSKSPASVFDTAKLAVGYIDLADILIASAHRGASARRKSDVQGACSLFQQSIDLWTSLKAKNATARQYSGKLNEATAKLEKCRGLIR